MKTKIELNNELKNKQSLLAVYESAYKSAKEITSHFINNDYWEITLHPSEDRDDERHLLWLLFNSRQSGFNPGQYHEDHQIDGARRFVYRINPISDNFITHLENAIIQTKKEINNLESQIKELNLKEKSDKLKSSWIMKNFYKIVTALIAFLTLLFTYLMWKKMSYVFLLIATTIHCLDTWLLL
jgi:hypothetical protein